MGRDPEQVTTIPHPIWFVAISLIAIPIASWLGASGGRMGTAVSVAA